MKGILVPTCRIGLLAAFMAASVPETSVAGLNGRGLSDSVGPLSRRNRNRVVFQVSSTPLASTAAG